MLFETIKIENGRIFHIDYHNKRANRSRLELFGSKEALNLSDYIEPPKNGLFRCKIWYGESFGKTEYFRYSPRVVKVLKIIESDIEYPYKYSDRKEIDRLFAKRESADDILIVKNGYIRDTSIANIAFFDSEKWITPNTPLLKGICRERLIDEGKIIEEEIKTTDLKFFKKYALLNAMTEFKIIENGIILQ
ncbi:aminotransferase class IV family protein [Nitrosophilus alvini]|uniref:aminotransferase class IV family protein n=1 Tax=Nitrosophilus alvini TaxID=2714855 RepID=UPI0019098555|nr:aminotransferase class IV family protein [Nitrosophilus alvini]